jgi:outer membrane protein
MPIPRPLLACLLLPLAAAVATPARAQDSGNWLLRARATQYDAGSGELHGLGLSLDNRMLAGLDIAVFFGPNVAAELSLTAPRRHTLLSNGAAFATLDQTPAAFTVQYHFTGQANWRPYLGVGINHTQLSSVQFRPRRGDAAEPGHRAQQHGARRAGRRGHALGRRLAREPGREEGAGAPGREPGGLKAGTFRIDPVMVSVGVGLRFLRRQAPGARGSGRQGVKAPARPRLPR